jgi:hypothetical protein
MMCGSFSVCCSRIAGILLTGIHLMQTGEVEANLITLNEEFRLSYIGDLVSRKLAGPEESKLPDADIAFHESEYQRLRLELQTAHEASRLPELPGEQTRAALNDINSCLRVPCVPLRQKFCSKCKHVAASRKSAVSKNPDMRRSGDAPLRHCAERLSLCIGL